jgi:hypothetical protein
MLPMEGRGFSRTAAPSAPAGKDGPPPVGMTIQNKGRCNVRLNRLLSQIAYRNSASILQFNDFTL